MLWIGLHAPALSLETLAATLGPAEAGRPLLLIEDHHVRQADAAALALGIRPGLKRATALALAPQAVLGQACHRRDAQALQALAHVALAFTPSVVLQPEPGRAGVQLEVQASLRYFGGLPRLLQRLQAALQPLGHRLQMATAPTALGAALLALWRDDLVQGPHSTDLAMLRRCLDALPVWLLGPGREHWEALQGMGLRTLGDLRALPRSGLARRFGTGLLHDIDRARGEAPEPQAWVTLPPVFESRLELFARADSSAQVLAGAQVLLARLVAWAQARHGRISGFTLRMHHEPRHRHDTDTPAHTPLDVALAEPAVDAAHLQQLLAERLGRAPLPAPALELSLVCERLVPGTAPNAELFPTHRSEREGLTRLVERLQARLGREGVCCLAAVAEHRPERATVQQPADAAALAAAAGAAAGMAAGAAAGAAEAGRHTGPVPMGGNAAARSALLQRGQPLWLLPAPQPLVVRAGRPWHEGRPLPLLAGPERIESGWWDEHLVTRDYYIAARPGGALLWIFCDRLPLVEGQGGGWFLQGWFG